MENNNSKNDANKIGFFLHFSSKQENDDSRNDAIKIIKIIYF